MILELFGKKYLGLTLTILLLSGLDTLDDFLVATAMPTVLEHLGGIGWYGWTIGAFGLASFATIPLFSGLMGRWGLRKTLLLAVLLFMAGSAAAALAPKMKLLVAGRVLQGLGMGGFAALPYAIISDYFPKESRSKALGLISVVFVLAGVVGPPLAAWLLERASWPWVFWINLPLGVSALLILFPALRRVPPSTAKAERLDLLGPFLFAVATGFSLKAFTSEWPWNLLQWGVSLAAALAFVYHERRHPNPVLPSDAWRLAKPLGAAFFGMILIMAAYSGAKIYLPLVLEGVWGIGTLGAGFILTLGSLTWDGGSILVSAAKQSPKHLAERGALATAGTLTLILATLWIQGPVWLVYLSWGLAGLGIGVTITIYNMVALEVAEDYPGGVAAATLQLAMTLGTAAGAAAANGIAQVGFAKGFDPSQLAAGALSGTSLRALILGGSLAKGFGLACAVLSFWVAWRRLSLRLKVQAEPRSPL